MSLSSALERLASYRQNNTRASQETFAAGAVVLKSHSAARLGEDGWLFFEQLFLAAIDINRLDVADQCLTQLGAKFPKSPRVDILTGIRMEATQPGEVVLSYYEQLQKEDATNMAAWKRRICVLRRTGKYEAAVEQLSKFLDTFYTDLEGWLELADIYSSCNQYTHALEALSHALLLAPQNPFTFLQFAETAYTAGDLPLALKMFLVVVDMGERDYAEDRPVGINIRAWMGIKLCTRHLITLPKAESASNTPAPNSKTTKLIDELATERVLMSYHDEPETGLKPIRTWLIPS